MSEAFEEVVAVLLEASGYWVKRNVKIHLSSSQQTQLGLKSGACELDVVAVRLTEPQEVLVVECKGFARSGGVNWNTFAPPNPPITRRHRYKLFWSKPMRDAVTDLLKSNQITPNLPHVYCLASAATKSSDHQKIESHLQTDGMRLLDRAWLTNRLTHLGGSAVYQNNTVATLAGFYHHPNNGNYL